MNDGREQVPADAQDASGDVNIHTDGDVNVDNGTTGGDDANEGVEGEDTDVGEANADAAEETDRSAD